MSALGLLNTNIPGGGFSLLVIITADGFKPIPDRLRVHARRHRRPAGHPPHVNEDAVQAGVRNNTSMPCWRQRTRFVMHRNISAPLALFPGCASTTTSSVPWCRLPGARRRLITINLALILEFGVRTRFLIMGQLLAILPKKELDLVRLQMNIFGGVDFDQKRAFLDAVLFDSRLVNRFVITGEMRMRLSWGDQPFFALAIGGLHPAFTPPPGLEQMQRAAIVFADSDDLKIRCDAYFAITSNTAQFGAHAELFAKKSKFSISGHAGFDVLIQFDPFQFIASMYASLQLKAGSTNLFKVSFAGELSGPRPLNVKGKASFEIWWMDFAVSFNATLVSGEKPPLPAPVDVGALLRTALEDSVELECRHAGDGRAAGQPARKPVRRPSHSSVERLDGEAERRSAQHAHHAIRQYASSRRAAGVSHSTNHDRRGALTFDAAISCGIISRRPSSVTCPMTNGCRAHRSSCCLPAPAWRPIARTVDSRPRSADFEEIVIPSAPEEPRGNYTTIRYLAIRFAQWSATG